MDPLQRKALADLLSNEQLTGGFQRWPDALSLLAHSCIAAWKCVLEHSKTLECVSGTMMAAAVQRAQTDIRELLSIAEALHQLNGSPIWIVAAHDMKLWTKQALALARSDVFLVLSTFETVPSLLENECCKELGLHVTQFREILSHHRTFLFAVVEEWNRALTLEEHERAGREQFFVGRKSKPLSIESDSPTFNSLLSTHEDPRLAIGTELLAPNESLSAPQIELINTHYVDPVVSLLHFHRNVMYRYERASAEIEKHLSSMEVKNTLCHVQSALRDLGPAVTVYAEALGTLMFTINTIQSALKEVGEWKSRVVESRSGLFALNHVVSRSEFCSSGLLCVEKLIAEVDPLLAKVQSFSSALLESLSGLLSSHSTMLYPLAQALAAVLHDLRKLSSCELDIEAKVLPKLTDLSPRRIVLYWCGSSDESSLSDPLAFLRHEKALEVSLDAIASRTQELLNVFTQPKNSLNLLASAIASTLEPMKAAEENQSRLLTETSVQLRTGDETEDSSSPQEIIDAIRLLEAQLSHKDEISPEDLKTSSSVLREMVKELMKCENTLHQMIRVCLADEGHESIDACRRQFSLHSRLMRAFGKTLYLDSDVLTEVLSL